MSLCFSSAYSMLLRYTSISNCGLLTLCRTKLTK